MGRLLNAIFILTLVALGIFASVFLYRDYQHLDALRKDREIMESRLAAMEREAAERADTVAKLKSSPAFAERVIREKLSYAKDDEVVFRFE